VILAPRNFLHEETDDLLKPRSAISSLLQVAGISNASLIEIIKDYGRSISRLARTSAAPSARPISRARVLFNRSTRVRIILTDASVSHLASPCALRAMHISPSRISCSFRIPRTSLSLRNALSVILFALSAMPGKKVANGREFPQDAREISSPCKTL